MHMPLITQHRNTNIITLYRDDTVEDHCQPGDIALKEDDDGWWTLFIGEDGQIHTYDQAHESYAKAMSSAKAAAEMSSE